MKHRPQLQFTINRKMQQNNAMHAKPPVARFANGERFSGGSVIAAVIRLK